MAPITGRTAAMAKDVTQPKRCATHGVSDAVTAPPICPPIFTMLEKTPELRPAMSTDTDQNELGERYRAPAPPARITPASSVPWTCDPSTSNPPVNSIATDAGAHRPVGKPHGRGNRS